MSSPIGTTPKQVPDDTADGYNLFRDAIAARSLLLTPEMPLFTTDAADLYDVFLAELSPDRRQHYVCRACRTYVERFGGLVTIDPTSGDLTPAFWPAETTEFFHYAVEAVCRVVEKAKVDGVFVSDLSIFGTPVTKQWSHLHAHNARVHKSRLKTPSQVIAEHQEEHDMLCRALHEFKLPTVEQAERILKSDTLYRSDKVLGVATWFGDLHRLIANKKGKKRDAIIWRALATAPAGFCHVRSTMIGTLLEDIESGLSYDEVARRFKEKMHPLQYRRPTAAPTEGQIAQAEKIVEKLASAGALRRRFATLEDVKATLWRPRAVETPEKPEGVFGHLKDQPKNRAIEIPTVKMTWEKFQRTVLPNAAVIELCVPTVYAPFGAMVTAADPTAPPILQWDHEDERNPMSWYLYVNGSPAHVWGLTPGAFVEVTAICENPARWGSKPLTHQGAGIMFILKGAKDSKDSGLALFPETLRSEYHEIRKTIEAFSNRGKIEGRENASASGIIFGTTVEWNCRLRVRELNGGFSNYVLDRRD